MATRNTAIVTGAPQGSRGASEAEHFDERLLVARARSGHSSAFAALYERYKLKVYRTALRILRNQEDAEDAAQRSFQRAFTNLSRFRGDSALSTWLTRIAINEALMMLRQRRTNDRLFRSDAENSFEGYGFDSADARPTPEETLAENELRTMIFGAISRLRKNLRIVVVLRDLHGLTSAETAQRLGLSLAAVKARNFHARRCLRRQLEHSPVAGWRGLPIEKRNGEIGSQP